MGRTVGGLERSGKEKLGEVRGGQGAAFCWAVVGGGTGWPRVSASWSQWAGALARVTKVWRSMVLPLIWMEAISWSISWKRSWSRGMVHWARMESRKAGVVSRRWIR